MVMVAKKDGKQTIKAEELSTEQLEQILRERYETSESSFREPAKVSVRTDKPATIDNIANNVFGIIVAVVVIGILFLFFMAMNNSSYNGSSNSSSSDKTDWNAYCRDMFPDNDEYSRAAREGCINGGKTTDNLIDGKYNK